jgi:hypothetical protein
VRQAALLSLLLLGACASADTERGGFLDSDRPSKVAAEADTGSCRPFFVAPSRDWGEGSAKHSCWNRLWEIPAAIITVPIALALLTAPVWVPIVLLR